MATKKTIPGITLPFSEVKENELAGELVDVVMRRSTIEDSSLHEFLLMESDAIQLDGSRKSFNLKNIATFVYPHIVSCVESPEKLREMKLREFMELDERDIDKLAAASQELNAHWWDRQTQYIQSLRVKIEEMTEEAQKKTGIPSNGSPSSTTQPTQKARSRRSRS